MCILCHTEQTLQEATSPFVQCSYVQRSTVLSQSKELLRSAVSFDLDSKYQLYNSQIINNELLCCY